MDQQNLAPRSVARWNVAAAVALMIALVPVLGAAQQASGNLRTIKPISNAVYAGLTPPRGATQKPSATQK
jgi:hypothetical protein